MLLCKIQRAQKKDKKSMGLREMLFLCLGWTGKKFGALRWLIRQNLRLSRKCVRWKAIFFGPEGMIGKGALEKWRVFPGTASWRVLRQSKVGLVNSAATWRPRCYSAGQIPRIYAILRGCPRLLITDLNHEPLTESIDLKDYLKWPSFFPSYN